MYDVDPWYASLNHWFRKAGSPRVRRVIDQARGVQRWAEFEAESVHYTSTTSPLTLDGQVKCCAVRLLVDAGRG
jgi:hypothetical protein